MGNILSQAFGGVIAAGVLRRMEGVRGLRAWRWLFIIEGACTIFFALIGFILLPDYPATTSWLSEREREIAQLRLVEDIGLADADFGTGGAIAGLKMAMRDPAPSALGLLYFLTVGGLSVAGYFPTVVKTLGYSPTRTLLLTSPPWVLAAIISWVNSWHSDKVGEKFFHWLWPTLLSMIGYIILLATDSHHIGARYFAMSLCPCAFSSAYVGIGWVATTIPRPPSKRAPAFAFVNASGNIMNIAAGYFFPLGFGPTYKKSFAICFGLSAGSITVAICFRQYLVHLNKKLDRGEVEALGKAVKPEALQFAGNLEGGKVEETQEIRNRFRYLY